MPSSLESLSEIKLQALRVEPYLAGDDEKGIEKVKETYKDLVDRFYHVSEHLVPKQDVWKRKIAYERVSLF